MYRLISGFVLLFTIVCFSNLGGLSWMCLVDVPSLLFVVGIVLGV